MTLGRRHKVSPKVLAHGTVVTPSRRGAAPLPSHSPAYRKWLSTVSFLASLGSPVTNRVRLTCQGSAPVREVTRAVQCAGTSCCTPSKQRKHKARAFSLPGLGEPCSMYWQVTSGGCSSSPSKQWQEPPLCGGTETLFWGCKLLRRSQGKSCSQPKVPNLSNHSPKPTHHGGKLAELGKKIPKLTTTHQEMKTKRSLPLLSGITNTGVKAARPSRPPAPLTRLSSLYLMDRVWCHMKPTVRNR